MIPARKSELDKAMEIPEEPKEEEKPEPLEQLRKAEETLAKIGEVTKKLEETNKVMDEAAAKALLAGKGIAQEGVKEETDIEYSERLLRGEI